MLNSLNRCGRIAASAGKLPGRAASLECPACGASIDWRPAVAAHLHCPACGTESDATGGTAWTPTTMNADGVTVGVLGSRDPVRSRGVRDALLASVRSALAQETP